MRPSIISGGDDQWRRSPEYLGRLEALRQALRCRYQTRMAAAGLLGRFAFRVCMEVEFRWQKRRIGPSRHSLYAGRGLGVHA